MMGGSINLPASLAWLEILLHRSFGLQPPRAREIEARVRLRGARPALIVVGNALNRELLEHELAAGSFPVRHARTGSEALASLRTAGLRGVPFGLAIIDHWFPDMTGFELAHAVRAGSTEG